MMDAVRSILCFDAMQAATRSAKGFTVGDISGPDFRDEEVRAYIKFCMASQAVEIIPERHTRDGRHVILYRAVADLAPVIVSPGEDLGKARAMLTERLAKHGRDRAAIARQTNLWTAIRGLRVFEVRTLAFHARTEDVWISRAHATAYVRALCSGGYVSACDDGYFRLSVAKNNGPFPVLALRGLLVDLNLLRAVNVTAQPVIQHDGRAA